MALLVSSNVLAQGTVPARYTWESNSERIAKSERVVPLGDNALGDSISLSNGSVGFDATDVSIPGNDKLPVEFRRSYVVKNWRYVPADGMLGDWMLDAPRISATFAPDWVASRAAPGARCSTAARPERPVELGSNLDVDDYFQGITIQIPGASSELLVTQAATIRPATGDVYRWVTPDGMTHVSCLSSVKNATGEGFLAITADGTRYWFDWMAQYQEAPIKRTTVTDQRAYTSSVAVRNNVLYATRVEDRFGNHVVYSYSNAWNQPAKLTSITASDGRQLTFSYTGQYLASVSDGSRTWSYAYGTTPAGRRTLKSVTLPDQSAWAIEFSGLTDAEIIYSELRVGESLRTCTINQIPENYALSPVGSITHPAGATGTFSFAILEHGRSFVPINCSPVQTFPVGAEPGTGNDEGDDENAYAISGYAFTLTSKQISGPGLMPGLWSYHYQPSISVHRWPGTTILYPRCVLSPSSECGRTVCKTGNCASSKTTVVAPNGDWERYSYGNSYRYNEGKLLKIERGASDGSVLQTVNNSYDFSALDQAYPARFGDSLKSKGNGSASAFHRPQVSSTIEQDGVKFDWTITGFDGFARPLTTVRSSSLGYRMDEEVQYFDRPASWVMGQVSQFTQAGLIPAQIDYDPSTALPLTYAAFGKVVQTLAWNADGTVASVKDGRDNVTTLSHWHRGVPRVVGFPDGTTQSAEVNALGWITSTTDQNGFTSRYSHDSMGRLASVTYPDSDSTAWNTKLIHFEKVGGTEYGLPAGHWRHTTRLGNKVSVAYLDALWRPVLTHEYDSADVGGTQRFQQSAYDHQGRQTFASYPGRSDALGLGTWTTYDAIGRITAVVQHGEHGELYTLTDYLSGFRTRVTSPNNYQTTTSFMAWDRPINDLPVGIEHPEGAYTDIRRDLLGKPTRITRRNADSSVAVSRDYVYNSDQRLCKTVEPETGATVMDYDSAGNLMWSASGQSHLSLDSCNVGDVAADQKVNRTYDSRDRLSTIAFPDGRGNQSWSYTPDGLPSQIVTNNSNGGDPVINAYSYNKRRLLTGESVTQPAWYTWSLGYGYDANGSLASVTYPTGRTYLMLPNALGQPTQVALQGGQVYASGVSYFPNGAIRQFSYGNGIVHTMEQNMRQLPARSTDQGGGNPLDLGYDYDLNANVIGITDYTASGRQTRTMEYDALDRLTGTQSVMFGDDGVAAFDYDVLDNLKRFKVGLTDHVYSYNANNQLQTINRQSDGAAVVGLSYDARGNLANKNGRRFEFDHGNRLRDVIGQEFYRYDGHGRRVQRGALAGAGAILSFYGQDGVLRYQDDQRFQKNSDYLYLGGSLIATVSDSRMPEAPVLSGPSYSSSGSYGVGWNVQSLANRYELQEQFNSGSWSTVYSGPSVSYQASGRAAGSYAYQIRACLHASCSGWSPTITVAVELPPSSAPTITAPAQAAKGNYSVGWTAVSQATSYRLEESANGGAWTAIYTGSDLSHGFNNRPGGHYAYRVTACNPAGCSPASASKTVQAVYAPAAPSPTSPGFTNTGSFSVSWGAVGSATRYVLEEQVNGGIWSVVHDGGGTAWSTGGRGTATYGYRAYACNVAGCSGYSATVNTQVLLPPASIPGLSVPAASTTGNYAVSWTAVGAATSYLLEEQLNGGTWTQVSAGGSTSWSTTGRTPGTYSYRVRACNGGGCTGHSGVGSIAVTNPIPLTPGGIYFNYAVMRHDLTYYHAHWHAAPYATYYELRGEISYTGGNQSYWTQKNKVANPAAIAKVRACNPFGCSSWVQTQVVGGM